MSGPAQGQHKHQPTASVHGTEPCRDPTQQTAHQTLSAHSVCYHAARKVSASLEGDAHAALEAGVWICAQIIIRGALGGRHGCWRNLSAQLNADVVAAICMRMFLPRQQNKASQQTDRIDGGIICSFTTQSTWKDGAALPAFVQCCALGYGRTTPHGSQNSPRQNVKHPREDPADHTSISLYT